MCCPAKKYIVNTLLEYKMTYRYTRRICFQEFLEVLTLSVHLEFMTSSVSEQSKHLES